MGDKVFEEQMARAAIKHISLMLQQMWENCKDSIEKLKGKTPLTELEASIAVKNYKQITEKYKMSPEDVFMLCTSHEVLLANQILNDFQGPADYTDVFQ